MKNIFVVIFTVLMFLGPAPTMSKAEDPLERLLLSSLWCHTWYNANTGYGGSKKVRFFANGTYSVKSRSTGYSSGYAGTFASQHDEGETGFWKVDNGILLLTDGNGPFEMINLHITTNSYGSPIITADGLEYSRCE